MDVWSLGCILGYMLLNGEPLFSNSYNIFGEVVSFLGNPTVHEMQEGLLANYSLSSYGGRIALQNLQKKFGNNELTAVWIPTMDAIFRYLPSNRIKVKNLLKLVVDTSRTLPKDYRLSATTKTDQIKIEMNIVELKPRFIKEYFNTVFSFRKSIADDARKDLIVLAMNLGNATPVPAELWINIFILAKTNPLTYKIRSTSKFDINTYA
jgi:serine/threonine protein kinase